MRPLFTAGWLVLLLATLCALAAAQGHFPAPTQVAIADDAEDDEGTKAIVTWKAPPVAEIGAYMLGGYEVHLQQLGGSYLGRIAFSTTSPAKDFELVALVPDGNTTQATVGNIVPWRRYLVEVNAVYVPADEGPRVAEDDRLRWTNRDVSRSRATVSAAPVRPTGKPYNNKRTNVLVWVLGYSTIVLLTIYLARRRDSYIRPIAGLEAVNDAIGRATEMGQPILYVAGLSGISDIATIAAMLILGHLAKRTAAYETPILVPCQDPIVMTAEREIVREAYLEAGKPQNYEPENIFFVTDSQFGYVAAVDGIMLREKPAANFYMGYFFAEALILAETGSASGAIQIAGTDADTQLPFFITACDYTLMGEELYAASAYLSRNPLLVAQLKGQDIGKIVIIAMLLLGAAAATIGAIHGDWEFLKSFVNWFDVHH